MQRLHYAEWEAAEWRSAAAALFTGRVQVGPHADVLRRHLADIFGEHEIHLVNAGRTAIRLALDVFHEVAPTRNCVVIPAYICPSVVETVQACGLVPVGAEVGADLNLTPESVAGELDEHTLAVIAPHMYGCPARIGEIERVCRSAGVFLIDDAAQVIGEKSEGRLLGTFGDTGLISFAQSKALVTGHRGSGGVLLVNNPALHERLRNEVARLPRPPACLGQFFHFVWNYLLEPYTGRSGYYFERIGAHLRPDAMARDFYQPATISNLWAAIACRQFERRESLRTGRIEVAAAYRREIGAIAEIAFPQFAPGRYLSRIMLLMPEHAHLPSLRAELAALGVQTRPAYPIPGALANNAPHAAASSRRLLEVPSYSRMSEEEVRSVCDATAVALTHNAVAMRRETSGGPEVSRTRA